MASSKLSCFTRTGMTCDEGLISRSMHPGLQFGCVLRVTLKKQPFQSSGINRKVLVFGQTDIFQSVICDKTRTIVSVQQLKEAVYSEIFQTNVLIFLSQSNSVCARSSVRSWTLFPDTSDPTRVLPKTSAVKLRFHPCSFAGLCFRSKLNWRNAWQLWTKPRSVTVTWKKGSKLLNRNWRRRRKSWTG